MKGKVLDGMYIALSITALACMVAAFCAHIIAETAASMELTYMGLVCIISAQVSNYIKKLFEEQP